MKKNQLHTWNSRTVVVSKGCDYKSHTRPLRFSVGKKVSKWAYVYTCARRIHSRFVIVCCVVACVSFLFFSHRFKYIHRIANFQQILCAFSTKFLDDRISFSLSVRLSMQCKILYILCLSFMWLFPFHLFFLSRFLFEFCCCSFAFDRFSCKPAARKLSISLEFR